MTVKSKVCAPFYSLRLVYVLALLWLWSIYATCRLNAALPSGFIETTINGPAGADWNEAAGLTFDETGRMYVWERTGKVWIQEYGTNSWSLLLDIGEEVARWNQHGLLAFALDPNFLQNGHIYLMYGVDRHHLMHFGTPSYHPNTNDYFSATVGRITRFTASASDGFRTVNPATRNVLVGESPQTGFPIMHTSHAEDSLVFGTDGTLLASFGDGGSWTTVDTGSLPVTYYTQALSSGIIRPAENVGAYRSQLIDSLSGKVIRIDPATGNGLPSNPFYDPTNPRAARSRVWCLGLRQPFRMTLRPETGSHNPADGNPGVLYIGDVGWNTWEDLNVVTGPGQNFGWPSFEGLEVHSAYHTQNIQNLDAPNPFFGSNGCTQQYLFFNQLIKQDTLNPVTFTNSCGNILPASIPKFLHTRPVLDWRHGSATARTGIYNGSGNATVIGVGAAGSPVSGSQFSGYCAIGGVWYTGNDFPAMYKNTYFIGDFSGWIRNIVIGTNNRPTAVRTFLSGAGNSTIMSMATHPIDGRLYYISNMLRIRRISYAPGGNFPPIAVATSDKTYGPGPLTVQFIGTNSSDPEGLPLTYTWNFGDGTPTNSQANPAHTFTASPGVPTKRTVSLTARDSAGNTNTATKIISVNNTPPSVTITSPVDGALYPMTNDTIYNLTANVTDTESTDNQLAYNWITYLYHNTHHHFSPGDTNHTTTSVVTPAGCDGNIYYYRIVLTVTDPAGLSTERDVFLYPDCPNKILPIITWPAPDTFTYGTALSITQLNAMADVSGNFSYVPTAGTFLNAGNGQTLTTDFFPTDTGNYAVTNASVTIDVLKANLTVTAENKIRSYGVTNPVFTVNYNGFVNNDDTNALFGAPDLSSSADTNSSVAGSPYAIAVTNGTLNADNYDFAFVNGTLTITQAALTVTADDKGMVYGEPLPLLTATYTGFVNGDTATDLDIPVALTTTAIASSQAGDYPIIANGGTDANYGITHINGNLTIALFELSGVTLDETGRITLRVSVSTNSVFAMEVSSDLQIWEPISFIQSEDGTITIEEQNTASHSQRYYRGVVAP